MMEEFLWVEKYRPKLVKDVILPERIRLQFESFIKAGNVPNLILSGGAGVGKTTIAKAILEELGSDYIVINGSMNGNIGTLREEILNFATTTSFGGGRKTVILDEADYLNAQSTMPSLRNFMEEYSKNCGFILTCNFPEKIIEPLHSRCTNIDFKISRSESAKLAQQFLKRVKMILDTEGITYDVKVLAEFIMMHFPDWRRVLNELQGYGMSGKIDAGILSLSSDADIKNLIALLKAKNFKDTRKWVVSSDINFNILCRKIYDNMYDIIDKGSIPQLVVMLADYSYKSAFVKDMEINTMALLTEMMADIKFL
jgi:DNA polymerase III delta prime subunit